MSRDIRSYFSFGASKKSAEVTKPRKTNKRPVILSSDEEESNNSKADSKAKAKKLSLKKNKLQIPSDSDEDVQKTSKNKPKSPTKKTEKVLREVSIDSIFAKTPIKRTNAPPLPKKLQKEEASVHDDDDFEATLNQSDVSEIDAMNSEEVKKIRENKKKKRNISDEETSPKKLKSNDSAKKIENKNGHEDEKLIQSTSDKSKKVTVTKAAGKHDRKRKLDIEIEDKPEKKKKSEDTEEIDLLEEHIAKKKQQSKAYQAYLHRGGARNHGSKPIPDGAENCLAGLTFVVTGVMESLERDEVDELIKKYGGRTVAALSKKTNYLVVGDSAGESKLTKARSYHVKQISEDELFELIRTLPTRKASEIVHSRSKKKESTKSPDESTSGKSFSPERKSSEKVDSKSTEVVKSSVNKKEETPEKINPVASHKKIITPPKSDIEIKSSTIQKTDDNLPKNDSVRVPYVGQAQALVEKYRPKSMKQIIGQHGDKSVAKKFYTWLQNWHKNRHSKVKQVKPSPWAKNDDGSFFKACLLSGPPGIGKTTTAQVVCNELGYDLLEFNASDTRSKRLLKEEISSLLSNTTVKGFYSTKSESKTSAKPVLLMDEVDGMAGNEDRGGLQELISLIKSTEIPIVCICNDRNNPKMRTLSNYIFDLRFQKPRIEQIRGAMKSLCCKENITISTENLDQLIQSTNHDIRQVINHLSMLISNGSHKNDDEKKNNHANKDLKLGPWDVVRKVFSAEEHKTMSIHDKSDLFFHDYNIAPLFVQENYLSVVPKCPKNEILERVAASAESLAMGDLVENSIRGNGSWSMLPVQACYSSVIPGSLMSGYMGGQINFPAWLGRYSKQGKFNRLLQEITVHTRLVTGASKEAINIDYLKSLRDIILRPLVIDGTDGVEAAVKAMNHYHLLREDLDSLVEVSLWPGQRDPMQSVETKVKAAFTRSYNKNAIPTPFSVGATTKKKSAVESQDSGFVDQIEDNGEQSEDNDEDDTLDSDRMVKAKKVAPSKTTASTSEKPAAKRGRGRGRGK